MHNNSYYYFILLVTIVGAKTIECYTFYFNVGFECLFCKHNELEKEENYFDELIQIYCNMTFND